MAKPSELKNTTIWYEFLRRFSSAPPVGLNVFSEHYELGCIIPTDATSVVTDMLIDLLKQETVDRLRAVRPARYFDVINVCQTFCDPDDWSLAQPVWVKTFMVVDRAFCKEHGKGRTMYCRKDEPDYVLVDLPVLFSSFRE